MTLDVVVHVENESRYIDIYRQLNHGLDDVKYSAPNLYLTHMTQRQ
jgi:hypothetical protein